MQVSIQQGQSLIVRITSADDEVIGLVNGTLFADLKFGQTNALELKDVLQAGDNYLSLLCINQSGPWKIAFDIEINGILRPEFSENVTGQDASFGLVHVFLLHIIIV